MDEITTKNLLERSGCESMEELTSNAEIVRDTFFEKLATSEEDSDTDAVNVLLGMMALLNSGMTSEEIFELYLKVDESLKDDKENFDDLVELAIDLLNSMREYLDMDPIDDGKKLLKVIEGTKMELEYS